MCGITFQNVSYIVYNMHISGSPRKNRFLLFNEGLQCREPYGDFRCTCETEHLNIFYLTVRFVTLRVVDILDWDPYNV